MNDGRPEPEGLALLVADGASADWEAALRSTPDDQARRVIESLRLLESVARVHRGDEAGVEEVAAAPPAAPVTSAASMSSEETPPQRWRHLELRQKLGEGGFGEVFRAWDPRLEREVALKLLKLRGPDENAAVSRVVAEGRLLAKVRHPNVVHVYGAEPDAGRVGLWMEYVRGRSLEKLLREQGPFGARETALIGVDLCRALAAVHGAGIVHRDVKAQNVMREEGGRIVLMDFGAGLDEARLAADAGSVSGTPLYMAPELFRDGPATPRSDLYSLGVLLYRLVTAAFPVTARSFDELRSRHERGEGKLLRDERPGLPEGFVQAVERATARDPERRFVTAGQMEQALAQSIGAAAAPVPETNAGKRARWWPVALGVILVAVAAFAAIRIYAPAGAKNPAGPSGDAARSPANSNAGAEPATANPQPLAPDRAGAARTQSSGATAARVEPTAAPGGGANPITPYTVEAGVYRSPASSQTRERLEGGARLALGDRLTLEFESSAPLYVYVLDEDDAGHSFALFPLPGMSERNPLAAGVKHVLPGSRDGRNLSWAVDSPGGREHLLVLASPERLVEFEADMNGLARPGQLAVPIPDAARAHLRGIGSLAVSHDANGAAPASRLFEMAQRLASRSEVTRGVWMRRLELENPRP